MSDDLATILKALRAAQRELARHVEPSPAGEKRKPARTLNRLLEILDDRELVAAQRRIRARRRK